MKKRKGEPSQRKKQNPLNGFYTPFRELDQHFRQVFSSKPANLNPDDLSREKAGQVPPRIKGRQDGEELFQKFMSDVRPLPGAEKKAPYRKPEGKRPRFLEMEELEAYTQLVDLVVGDGPFELSGSDEYVDGAVLGISPEVLKKLREGYFSCQDYIDLHGLNRQQAREEVTSFIMESFSARRRCVLVIPGRGLNSRDKEPVLKNSLVGWLTRAPLKRVVLAFSSARGYDGGWGAFYILLRKNEGKAPLLTPAL